jgi:hypothetical protein
MSTIFPDNQHLVRSEPLQQKNHSGMLLWWHWWKCRKTTSTFGTPGRGTAFRRHHGRKSAPVHRWCRARTIGGSGCRRDIAGGTPAAQQPSSVWGVATSISSSSLPSTHRSMRGGANHLRSILTPRQRHMRRPQPVRRLSSTLLPSGQMPAKRCGIVHRW